MEVAREPLYFLFEFKASITRLISKIHRETFHTLYNGNIQKLISTLLRPSHSPVLKHKRGKMNPHVRKTVRQLVSMFVLLSR